MDYVQPTDVARAMVEAGRRKLALAPPTFSIRSILSGAILGIATSLALTGAVQTGQPFVGALVFPVGIGIIVLLGLELITGSFALVPLPWVDREASGGAVLANWGWVFLGNLIGALAYGALLAIALTNMGTSPPRRRCRAHRADRRSQDRRLCRHRHCRHRHRLRQGDAVQLDGLSCTRACHDHDLDRRQARRSVDADLHLLRAGLRALRRQHVHHPDRHDDGRQGDGRPMVAVESDSGDARQSGRRFHLHRTRHLHDLQAEVGVRRKFRRRRRPACPPSKRHVPIICSAPLI